jgi:membrane-associated phospholipid phosphatase
MIMRCGWHPSNWRRWRRYVELRVLGGIVAAIAAIWAFSNIFEDVWDRDPLVRWDAAAASWVHARTTPRGVRILGGLTQLGSSTFILLLALAIAPALWRRRALVVGWLFAFVGGVSLESLFKEIAQRTRPPYAAAYLHRLSYSFPSGHAMASMIGYTMLAYLLDRLAEPRGWRRAALYVGAGALILAIGVSRIYIGVHYPSDVLGGFAAGAAWVAICLTAVHLAESRGRRSNPQ